MLFTPQTSHSPSSIFGVAVKHTCSVCADVVARVSFVRQQQPSLSSRQHDIMPSDDRDDIIQDWRKLMNMDAKELEDFLQTPESNDCGQKDEDGEAKGHKSGR